MLFDSHGSSSLFFLFLLLTLRTTGSQTRIFLGNASVQPREVSGGNLGVWESTNRPTSTPPGRNVGGISNYSNCKCKSTHFIIICKGYDGGYLTRWCLSLPFYSLWRRSAQTFGHYCGVMILVRIDDAKLLCQLSTIVVPWNVLLFVVCFMGWVRSPRVCDIRRDSRQGPGTYRNDHVVWWLLLFQWPVWTVS